MCVYVCVRVVYVWVCARVNDVLAEVDGAHKRLSELDQGAPTPHGCACVCQYMSVCMCARKGCVGSTRVHTHAPGYEYHTYPKQQPGYESQHFIGHVCIATVCRTSSQATRNSI